MSLLANSLYYISLTSLYVNYHKLPHMTLRFALANPDLKNMFFFAFYCTFKKLCSEKNLFFHLVVIVTGERERYVKVC